MTGSPSLDSSALPMRSGAQQAAKAIAVCMAAQGMGAALYADLGDAGDPVHLPEVTVYDDAATQTVSSLKYTQPVLDTPQTIAVIPSEVYSAQGATTLSDVLKNTPGITFFAGEGGSANRTGGDSFYLRGFDTSNSIFIDGVRSEGAVVHDTFNIGSVEVFKGPAADNGRGGTAGYINLETKVPQPKASEDLLVSHTFSERGSRNSDRVSLDVNQPLPSSVLPGTAFRLNLLDQQGGVPGRKYVENSRWGVAPSLAFGLGSPTRVFVTYQHLYENNLPDYGLPSTIVSGLAPAPTSTTPSLFSPGADTSAYFGFVNDNYEHVTNDAGTVRVEHDFSSSLRLTNQTRADSTERKIEASSPSSAATVPMGLVSLNQGIYETKNEIISNQTNLSDHFSTGSVAHDFSAGAELSRETSDNPLWATVNNGVASPSYLTSVYAPTNFPVSLLNYAPQQTGSFTNTRINTSALYAFDTVKLNKFWQAVGGVRLEHYNVSEQSVVVAVPAIAAVPASPATATIPATAAVAAAAAVPASSTRLTAGKSTASWKGGLIFKPAPNGSLYVSYDTSVRPPGTSGATNTLSTTTTSADNPLLDPEKAVNYEAGVKWTFFKDRLLADVAFFKSVNKNVPSADPVTGLVNQTSDQTVEGVEFGVSGKITNDWLVFAGYSQMNASVSNELSTNAQGLTLPLLPKASGNLWTTYRIIKALDLGAGAQYMGETKRLQATNAPTATTFNNQVPSYWLYSAMVTYAVNNHLNFRLNVNNLAGKQYIASLNNNGNRVNLGPPRSFLITAEIKF